MGGRSGNYVANVLELAASGQLEHADGVKEASNRLRAARGEHFRTSFRSDMAARHYSPALVDQLGGGILKADKL